MKTSVETILLNQKLRRDAECLILKCGIHANLKGFSRLTDAVVLYAVDDGYALGMLYRVIGEYRSLKPKTVIREMSYAISQSPRLAALLSELVGASFCADEIHTGLVIAALATVLRAQWEEEDEADLRDVQ